MKRIRQILSWISREIVILAKITIGFGKYLLKLLKKVMKAIWKGGLKMKRLILWLFLVAGLAAGLVIGTLTFGWIFPVLLLLLGIVFFFLFARFVKVDEGTAKAIMVFGKFSKIIFQWEKHWIDTEWSIWREGEGRKREKGSKGKTKKRVWGRIVGGLWVYFWPFQKIHLYKHRWTDIRLRDSKMEVEFHEKEVFDHALLKPAVYAFKLTAVETKPPERIPVDVLVLVTLRIRNPYLFLFVAPPTPVEDILARIAAETRALVTSCSIDKLLRLKGASFWSLLKGAKVIEDTLEKWGVKIADKGIEIREIDLLPEYQKAAAAKRTEEMRAAGRAEELMGTVISAVARAEGKPEGEIQGEFRQNPEEFYKKHKTIIDNTMTKLSVEEGAYLRIETPGATAFGGEFLRFIGAWLRMPMGGKGKEEKEPSGPEKETEEEKEEEKKEREEKQQAKEEKEKQGPLTREEKREKIRKIREEVRRTMETME